MAVAKSGNGCINAAPPRKFFHEKTKTPTAQKARNRTISFALTGLEVFAIFTQGVARRLALPWAILFRAFSPMKLPSRRKPGFTLRVQTPERIKYDLMQLSAIEQKTLLDWLANLLEDRLELTDEFKAEIKSGQADIAADRVRIRPGRAKN